MSEPSDLVKRIRAYSYKDAADVQKLESELAEWQARAEGMIAATVSYVDGRDLLAELKPLHWHYCNIKVRINGQWKEYEGDWLKRLFKARGPINAAQAAQDDITQVIHDCGGDADKVCQRLAAQNAAG